MGFSAKLKRSVELQRLIGWVVMPVLGHVIIGLLRRQGYFIEDQRRHRAFYREVLKDRRPLLICSNHLTMIDSVVLHWAFAPVITYMLRYRFFSWNVPAREVFAANWFYRFIIYLSKCIPIDRTGAREHHDEILEKMEYILRRGDPFVVFPEGGRSRRGTFDLERLTYGIGRLLHDVPDCRVLCVYLRGDRQEHYTAIPPVGSRFTLDCEVIEPRTDEKGMRGERDLAMQVGQKIKEMETRWFAARGRKIPA